MRKLFDYFLFSHLFIALAASSLFLFYAKTKNLSFSIAHLVFIFLGTNISYNLIELFPTHELSHYTIRGSFLQRNKKLVKFQVTIFSFALFFSLPFISKDYLYKYSLLFPLIFLYENLLFKSYSLRKIPYLKSFYIALVWAFVVLEQISLFNFLEVFLFILALCIAFDLRDFELDLKTELKTLPHLFRKNGTIIFSSLLFLMGSIFAYSERGNKVLLSEGISFLLFLFLINKLKTNSSDYLCYFGIDGLIFLKWLYFVL